jgi:hypothetical protein
MIKKILMTLIFLLPLAVFANYNDVYIADIQYDWINKSAMEKEEMINEIHDIIFSSELNKRHYLKSMFKDKLKDKNHIDNYLAASAGYKEYKGNRISAFYYKKMQNPFMYALQDNLETSNAFYYDAMGNLRYVDFINGDYPDYPYYAIQYRIGGTPVSAVYYISEDCQYLYKPNGEFEGVWYKHNLYNKKNKIILKRTTY